MAQVCIICGKEAAGIPVEDTQAIMLIRAVKKKLNIASNNKLVVSYSCLEEYKKRRKSFEGKLVLHTLIAVALVILAIVMPLMAGALPELGSVFLVLLLGIFIVFLAFLNYTPSLAKGYEEEMQKGGASLLLQKDLSGAAGQPIGGAHGAQKGAHSDSASGHGTEESNPLLAQFWQGGSKGANSWGDGKKTVSPPPSQKSTPASLKHKGYRASHEDKKNLGKKKKR